MSFRPCLITIKCNTQTLSNLSSSVLWLPKIVIRYFLMVALFLFFVFYMYDNRGFFTTWKNVCLVIFDYFTSLNGKDIYFLLEFFYRNLFTGSCLTQVLGEIQVRTKETAAVYIFKYKVGFNILTLKYHLYVPCTVKPFWKQSRRCINLVSSLKYYFTKAKSSQPEIQSFVAVKMCSQAASTWTREVAVLPQIGLIMLALWQPVAPFGSSCVLNRMSCASSFPIKT